MKNAILTNLLAQNPPEMWLGALVSGCLAVALLSFCTRMLAAKLRRDEAASTSRWHHLITDIILSTRMVTQAAAGLWIAMRWLHIPAVWERRLHALVVVIALFQLGTWVHRGMGHIIDGLLKVDADSAQNDTKRTSRGLLRSFSSLLIWTAVVLLTLENLGVNISALVTGVGITGVAFALATQSLISDMFASVSIILDKPFVVGDFIVLDSGFQGKIDRIGVRTTRVRSITGEELVFSNSDLVKSRLRNYRSMCERRILFNFSVRYETPMSQLERIADYVRDAVESADDTRFDRAEMLNFGESGLGFEIVYYVLTGDYNAYTAAQQQINFRIMKTFAKHDIQFAYRTTLVLSPRDVNQQSQNLAA